MQNPNGYPVVHHFPSTTGAPGFPGGQGFPFPPFPQPLLPPGFVPIPSAAAVAANSATGNWTQFKTSEGRPYYFNALTNQTVWEKPNDLKSEAERLLDACPWKEYKTDDGKVYFHNIVTKASAWSIPNELEELKQKVSKEKESLVDLKSVSKTSSEKQPEAPTSPEKEIKAPEPEESDNEDSDSNDSSLMPTELPPSIPPPSTDTPKDDGDSGAPQKSDYEQFREILREHNIASNASWENCLKYVSTDPRFERFRSHSERKKFFQTYKTARAKEEKEEMKNRVKKAKEHLHEFLRTNPRVNSNTRYRYACDLFRDHDSWKLVPDQERREIFEEAVTSLAKKERDEARELRKRNMRVLADILDSMTSITFRTTWQEAQQLLLDNSTFAEDAQLLGMDKEDALIVFEEHIRQLENEEEQEKLRERKILQRDQRRNREAFSKFLDELHASGKLNSLSKWSTLYHDVSADSRFEAMLSQPLTGSNPLDLFKFYVEDLKARYEDEKHLIKDILKSQNFIMTSDTEFSEFVTILSQDPRSGKLDSGNVKLMHEKLLDRERDKLLEKQREEMKSRKKLESQFLNLLSRLSPPLNEDSTWEQVRPQICNDKSFQAIASEEERIQVFDAAIRSLVETCSHHHNHKTTHKHQYRNASGSNLTNSSKQSSKKNRSKKPSGSGGTIISGKSRSRRSRSSSVLSYQSSLSELSSASSVSSSSSSSMLSSNDNSGREYVRERRSSSQREHKSRRLPQSSLENRKYSRSPDTYCPQTPPPNVDESEKQISKRSHHRSRDPSFSPTTTKRSKSDNYSSRSKSNNSPSRTNRDSSTAADLEELEQQRKLLLQQLNSCTSNL